MDQAAKFALIEEQICENVSVMNILIGMDWRKNPITDKVRGKLFNKDQATTTQKDIFQAITEKFKGNTPAQKPK